MQTLRDIAFEEIIPGYSWGQYGDFKVIIQMDTGYINVTRLCEFATTRSGARKKLDACTGTKAFSELKEAVSAVTGIPVTDLTHIRQTGDPHIIRGTYVHPDLLPHVAAWSSADFAIKVARIVNAYLVREYRATIDLKDTEIARQTRMIEEQTRMIREQTQQIKELLGHTTDIKVQNASLHTELKATQETIAATNTELETAREAMASTATALETTQAVVVTTAAELRTVSRKLTAAVERCVPAGRPKDEEVVEIWAKPRKNPRDNWYMKALRRSVAKLSAGQAGLERQGYTEFIASVDPTPNAVELWRRVHDELQKESTKGRYARVLKVNSTSFVLNMVVHDHYTAADIQAMLRTHDAEKRRYGHRWHMMRPQWPASWP